MSFRPKDKFCVGNHGYVADVLASEKLNLLAVRIEYVCSILIQRNVVPKTALGHDDDIFVIKCKLMLVLIVRNDIVMLIFVRCNLINNGSSFPRTNSFLHPNETHN